jgi:hypothetical protein
MRRLEMTETPQARPTETSQVPPQTRGQEAGAPAAAPGAGYTTQPPEGEGGSGWLLFAAMVMIMAGSFQAIQGLVALFQDDYFIVGRNGLVIDLDFTAWGWTHLVVGVLAIAAAFGVLAGKTWAQVVAIGLALVSAVIQLGFLAAFPLWAMTIIALDILVVYAITVHGDEIER